MAHTKVPQIYRKDLPLMLSKVFVNSVDALAIMKVFVIRSTKYLRITMGKGKDTTQERHVLTARNLDTQ